MIRVKIAEWLLRSMGATVEYRVKRLGEFHHRVKDGRTLQRSEKLREALRRFRGVRVGSNDTITVQLVAVTHQRHGDIYAGAKQ